MITVAEDLVVHEAQSVGGLDVAEMHSTCPRTFYSPTVLGPVIRENAEQTVSVRYSNHLWVAPRLHPKPPMVEQKRTRSPENALPISSQVNLQSVAKTNMTTSISMRISSTISILKMKLNIKPLNCTALATYGSNAEPAFSKRKSPKQFRQKNLQNLISYHKPRLSRNQSKSPLTPLSPFLRSSLPQPAPLQSLIPLLIPHRRIPTLFRIAKVHRLLATLPPAAPPQRIELYATVASSHRCFDVKIQEFTFADLFFPH